MEANNDFKSKTATTPFYNRGLEDDSKEESKYYNLRKKRLNRKGTQSLNILASNLGNCRYPGFSEFQSESSMQSSSYCYTIPKQLRFNDKRHNKNDSIYTLPSMKMAQTTTIGFGLRKDFRPVYGRDSPSPSRYQIYTCFDWNRKNNKGFTIANKYKEVMDDAKRFPGPGTYKIPRTPKGSDIPITIKSRQMFFYDEDIRKKKYTVSMQRYTPSLKLVQNSRFNSITFGIGKRTPNENMNVMRNPGPGAYNVPSIFTKGFKSKIPLN